jgi:hypothetical protein
MASAHLRSPGAALAPYRAQGWRAVPGNGRALYDPDSFDPADPLGLILLRLDSHGRARTSAGWQDGDMRRIARAACAAIAEGR